MLALLFILARAFGKFTKRTIIISVIAINVLAFKNYAEVSIDR